MGLSILLNKQGRECLHPLIVMAMFGIDYPENVETIQNGFINHSISQIKSKD